MVGCASLTHPTKLRRNDEVYLNALGAQRIPENLARQGTETVRTVTQKPPVLNQAADRTPAACDHCHGPPGRRGW
jgi:type III secretory pathway component EscR